MKPARIDENMFMNDPRPPVWDPVISYIMGGTTSPISKRALHLSDLYEIITVDHRYWTLTLRKAQRQFYSTGGKEAEDFLLAFKARFDFVLPGGVLPDYPSTEGAMPSGIQAMTIEIRTVSRLEQNKASVWKCLLEDPLFGPSIALMYTSVCGRSLEIFFRVDLNLRSAVNYYAIHSRLAARYPKYPNYHGYAGKLLDKYGNIQSPCYIGYAPDAYYNDRALHFPVTELRRLNELERLEEAALRERRS